MAEAADTDDRVLTAVESAGMVELGHDSVEVFEEPEL